MGVAGAFADRATGSQSHPQLGPVARDVVCRGEVVQVQHDRRQPVPLRVAPRPERLVPATRAAPDASETVASDIELDVRALRPVADELEVLGVRGHRAERGAERHEDPRDEAGGETGESGESGESAHQAGGTVGAAGRWRTGARGLTG